MVPSSSPMCSLNLLNLFSHDGVQLRDVCWTSDTTLVRERLSEKAHATIPKGIVGGFEFTVLQRNLEKWQERPWTYV